MRIAVVSDLHGNLEAVKAVWGLLGDTDRIFCLGDIVGIGPRPSEVLDLVRSDPRVVRVKGNHDHNTLHGTELGPIETVHRGPHHLWVKRKLTRDQLDFLPAPVHIEEVVSGSRLSFMHRHPSDFHSKVPYFMDPSPAVLDDFYSDVYSDIIFFGHTHFPLDMVGRTGKRYVNPGAVGVQNSGMASFVVIDAKGGSLAIERREAPYDIGYVKEDILDRCPPFHRTIIDNFFS